MLHFLAGPEVLLMPHMQVRCALGIFTACVLLHGAVGFGAHNLRCHGRCWFRLRDGTPGTS